MIKDILKNVVLNKYYFLNNSSVIFKLRNQSFYSIYDVIILIHN